MKPNNKIPETYQSRVAQFERELRQGQKKTNVAADSVSSENPYLQARIKVLNSYSQEQRDRIQKMESNQDLDNSDYERFVLAILREVGDVPTHGLRKRTEQCGCFLCKGRKS